MNGVFIFMGSIGRLIYPVRIFGCWDQDQDRNKNNLLNIQAINLGNIESWVGLGLRDP